MRLFFFVTLALLISCKSAIGQKKSGASNLEEEFVKMESRFEQRPLQLSVHIQNKSEMPRSPMDTMQTDLNIYYGRSQTCVATEGMEELVNDSLIIFINHPVKRIQVLPNQLGKGDIYASAMSRMRPDSMLKAIKKGYSGNVAELSGSMRSIQMSSKSMVSGTQIARQSIKINYNSKSYEIAQILMTKTSLLPITKETYLELQKDTLFAARTMQTTGEKGDLYFMIRSNATVYSFKYADASTSRAMIQEEERIKHKPDGTFEAAKGYEDYTISTSL